MRYSRWFAIFAATAFSFANVTAADWIHWRGPEQNGHSKETGLPATFDLTTVGEKNLIWKEISGGRSAPLVMKGRIFVLNGYDTAKLTEGERIQAFDAETGKPIWELKFGVFHTDIVSSRLGWTSLTADPASDTIFAHTTAGTLYCLKASDGSIVWHRQLTEEFGRVSGYGGRIVSPIFDSGLVMLTMVNASGGDQARLAFRILALDAKTGAVAWWSDAMVEAKSQFRSTYNSNPIVAVINGQRLLIAGGGDGAIHAVKVRTGERVWSHVFSAGAVNPSPVAGPDGKVYICHGEENPEGSPIGRVICLDGNTVTAKKPKVVWDTFRRKMKENNGAPLSKRFGLSAPALADGILYVPDDGGDLHVFDAATGELLWKYKYGTASRGAPLIADGRLYIFEVNAKLTVINKVGRIAPDPANIDEHIIRERGESGFIETNGTVIAVNGKLYFQTNNSLFCVGDPKAKTAPAVYTPLAEETPFDANAAPSAVMIVPAEVTLKAGEKFNFAIRYVDANGRELPAPPDAKAVWSLPLPAVTPTGAQPPALAGEFAGSELTLAKAPPAQQGNIVATVGNLTARARVRVAPTIPFKPDFSKIPLNGAPGGWINTQGKYFITEYQGKKVLQKVNNDSRPLIARAVGYITPTTSSDYTIQADLASTMVGGKMADIGLVNSRYTMLLDGKVDPAKGKLQVRFLTWEARNRINHSVDFPWEPDTWYTTKFTVEIDQAGKNALLKGKIWKQGTPEPEKWTIEFTDPNPNKEGAAGVYAYISNADADVPGSPAFYDNVIITPNKAQIAPEKK